MADRQPLKILSLDGGGVRGIATLHLLRALMLQIALSTDQRPDSLRPCDYFDLIAGTSTGGLIAIMLGRLRYTVDQTIEKYIALSKDTFSALSTKADARFDHLVLEKQIKQVITEAPCPRPNTLTADELLEDETVDLPQEQRVLSGEPVAGCRMFVVCTIPRGLGSHAAIFRSYKTSFDFPFSGKIWEAARATSAAPTFFAPITIGRVKYGDGATGWNNPTRLVINEVRRIWRDRPIGCLISLGTGEEDPNQLVAAENLPTQGFRKKVFSSSMPKTSFKLEVAKYCVECLKSCKRIHEEVLDSLEDNDLLDSYFRLNTPGVGKIGLAEWEKIGDMFDLTEDYLNAGETKRMKIIIASKIVSCRNLEGSQQLPIRHLNDAGPQGPSGDNGLQAPAFTGLNPRSNSSSRPVAYLLGFAAYCSLLAQRFDAIKHIAPSLHRLNLSVMGLTQSLRQLCFNMLIQVPSSTSFDHLVQIEALPDPDIEIPLLPLLGKDPQTCIDFFRIISKLQKSLKDMETELNKLIDRIAEKGIETDPRQIEALVRSCDFDVIHAEVKTYGSCFKQLLAKLQRYLFEKDRILQSSFTEQAIAKNTPNTDLLLVDPIVARSRLVRGLSSEVYWALAKACGDHACHSAQFQLRPYHAIERDSQTFVDFQIRFSSDITTLSPSDASLHSAWLSIKSPYKENRCADKRRMHKVLKRRQLDNKRKFAETFDQNSKTDFSANKQVKQQTEAEMIQLSVDHKFAVAGRDIEPYTASSSSAKGVDFLAWTNFCSRIMAYGQEQCLNSHRYLGFFRGEKDSEHQVFFSDAYQKLSQCQCTSLYDILAAEVPVTDRKSFQHERVELAKQLASAMLQFQNSPLLHQDWGGDDVVFFRQPKSGRDVRSILTAPYLNVQIQNSSRSSLVGIDEDDAFEGGMTDSFVKNEYLFQLATLFIEIAYQAEMEDLMSLEEVRLCDDNPELERWFVADRLCEEINSNLGSRYRAIVRLCLDCSLQDDHLVEIDKYEDMICREVVNELEELKIAMVDEQFG